MESLERVICGAEFAAKLPFRQQSLAAPPIQRVRGEREGVIDLRLPARTRARPDDPDPDAVRLVQETRQRLVSRLTLRDRWGSLLVGGGFLAAAVPLALLHGSSRSPSAAA